MYARAAFDEFALRFTRAEFLSDCATELDTDLDVLRTQMSHYAEEARFGLDFLRGVDLGGKRVLEVGSGAGILSAWLSLHDIDITPLEPRGIGFDHRLHILKTIWSENHLPLDRLLTVPASGLEPSTHGMFDLIFSVNVLEHVDDLPQTFAAMASVLAPGGVSRHTCPNYVVPYENHYGLPLLPGLPTLSAWFAGVARTDLWQSLNFITYFDVRRLARANRQAVRFEHKTLHAAFARLGTDPMFQKRHPLLARASATVRATGALALLARVPPALATPMVFECEHRFKTHEDTPPGDAPVTQR